MNRSDLSSIGPEMHPLVRAHRRIIDWMDRTLYPSFAGNWDDELFRREILACLQLHHTVLDIGAGAGIVAQMNFKGLAASVHGVDLDPRVLTNPNLDAGVLGKAEELPYANESFDIVFADNVLEHLADPIAAFREAARVLRPGGYFLAKTPNRWHYMVIAASATPHWFHRWYNGLRGRRHSDTFPTLHDANSTTRIKQLARDAGFRDASVMTYEGRPEYLRLTPPTYIAGLVYERLVNRFDLLKEARILLIAKMQKP